VCHQDGKSAQSHYQVTERLDNPVRTRVIFSPLTGRTHQLRIHSLAFGHPILGCDLYGAPKTAIAIATKEMAPRLLLHALDISFSHPQTQKRMTLTSPCPF
jgi:tRNA pseudouridine32 synthase/23S rRNA pseudouridine746 synthase